MARCFSPLALQDPLTLILGAALYFIVIVLSLFSSYALSARFLRGVQLHTLSAAVAIGQIWILIGTFRVLAWVSLFNLWAGLGFLAVLAFAVARLVRFSFEDLLVLWGRIRGLLELPEKNIRKPILWVSIASLLLLSVVVLRGLIAPPLAWDSLTYHLVKPALAVQNGGDWTHLGPGATLYYNYFQSGGETLTAWAFLCARGDGLLALACLHSFLVALVLLYASLREIGTHADLSALATIAIASVPASFAYVNSGYVDTLHAGFLLYGVVLLIRNVSEPSAKKVWLAFASLGIATALKVSTLPILAVCILLAGWLVFKRMQPGERRSAVLLVFALFSIALPDYIVAWVDRGSPFYPMEVRFAGNVLFTGNEELSSLFTAGLIPNASDLSLLQVFEYLFVVSLTGWNHLNFGFGGLLLVLFAAIGIVRGLLKADQRRTILLLLCFTAVGLLPFVSDSTALFRKETWAPIIGRLFLFPFAAFVVAGVANGRGWTLLLPSLALVLNALQWVPAGWESVDAHAFASVLPWFIACVVFIAATCFVIRWPRAMRGTIVCAGLSLLCVLYRSDVERRASRYTYYAASSFGGEPVFDVHPLEPYFASAWELWRYLDEEEPRSIAVSAGWDGFGHNIYWYPFLGSRFQNTIQYVPVTRDGSLIDHRLDSLVRANASYAAWLGRLVERDVDHVALLNPAPLELDWVEQSPQVFQEVVKSLDGGNTLFRVNKEMARQELDSVEAEGN